MSDKVPQLVAGLGWRYDTEHSMLRRMQDHDYRSRCIYMLTLTTEDRVPLLGTLCCEGGNAETARIAPSALGQEVQKCWLQIPTHYPGVKSLAFQLMPDHIHGLLFVTREQQAHLGTMVNGFKVGCNRAFRELGFARQCLAGGPEAVPQETGPATQGAARSVAQGAARPVAQGAARPVAQGAARPVAQGAARPVAQGAACSVFRGSASGPSPRPKHPAHGQLFAPGYQDSVLKGKDQLERMFAYIADNPRRLAVKRQNPDLFRIVSQLTLGTQTFAAIGNRWLLDRPERLQVRCHNNSTPENLRLIAEQKAYFLERGKAGAVIVSPCISAGEKEIARAALDARQPLIVILENGFPPLYKPPGKYFEACAAGLLLMLAPWPYHMEARTITRQQCLALNEMARRLCE